MKTIRQLAAREFGQGSESAGATTQLWAALPTMDLDDLERLVREAPISEQFSLISAAIKHSPSARSQALKARFTPEEISAMVTTR